MERDPLLLLWDVKRSVEVILRIKATMTLEDYSEDDVIRPAVERHFEIMGEALNRLRRTDPALASRITDLHRAIAFRNILIHGYDAVEDAVVWNTISRNLPSLLSEIDGLVAEQGTP